MTGGTGGTGGGSGTGGNINEAVRKHRRRSREIFEHRPKELHFLVNGFVLGSQSINSDLSEQTLDINLTERIGFVEVVSEQEVPLLFVNIDPPPDGPVKQPARAEFSDGRSLDLELSFSSTWPTLHVVYSDPLLAPEQPLNVDESETANQSALRVNDAAMRAERPTRIGEWIKSRLSVLDWKFLYRPSTVTAILALVVVAALLLTKFLTPHPILSAGALLQQSITAEDALAARTDQVLHRSISLEEKSTSGDLIARRTIEIWQSAEKKLAARRVYDDKGRLIGGEWTKADGSRVIYHHGSKPQSTTAKQIDAALTPEDIWQLDPSSKVFSSLIGQVEAATVEENSGAYVFTYQARGAATGTRGLVKATLTLSRNDLHATELTLLIKAQEFHFVESAFERRAPNTVAPAVFEPEPELLSSAQPETRNSKLETENPAPNSQPPTPVLATADLEIEVMRLLSDAKADLGEQISATRSPEGILKVQGIVDTDKRKREILTALSPVTGNPAVKITIQTVAEAVAEQKQTRSSSSAASTTMERVEAGSDQFPAYTQLRRRFSEEESRRFADRMVELTRQAMSHAGAMKRLTSKFSSEDLRTMVSNRSGQ